MAQLNVVHIDILMTMNMDTVFRHVSIEVMYLQMRQINILATVAREWA